MKSRYSVEYEVVMISKEKNRIGADMPREFGGIEPGRMEHTVETIDIPAKTDTKALEEAERIASEKDSTVLFVRKTWNYKS